MSDEQWYDMNEKWWLRSHPDERTVPKCQQCLGDEWEIKVYYATRDYGSGPGLEKIREFRCKQCKMVSEALV